LPFIRDRIDRPKEHDKLEQFFQVCKAAFKINRCPHRQKTGQAEAQDCNANPCAPHFFPALGQVNFPQPGYRAYGKCDLGDADGKHGEGNEREQRKLNQFVQGWNCRVRYG